MRRFFLLIVDFYLCVFFCQCQNGNNPLEETRFLMDTIVRVSVYPQKLSEENARIVIHRAFELMKEIESKTSVYIDSSDVSRIIERSGQSSVSVSPEVADLLAKSINISERSNGAFDVTIGVIKELWQFDSDYPIIPDKMLVQSLLPIVDYRQITIEDSCVKLGRSGMRIDLGGVAKGYIIDQGVAVLMKGGIQAGIVEAGGDLRIFGRHPRRKVWRIGIRHPRAEHGEFFGIMEIGEISIATSGDYERCFFRNGIRYHHILDPQTGFPAGECISVTIVAESAVEADAYATAVFVLGPEKGMALIESIPNVDGLILYEESGQIQSIISGGLLQNVKLQ